MMFWGKVRELGFVCFAQLTLNDEYDYCFLLLFFLPIFLRFVFSTLLKWFHTVTMQNNCCFTIFEN
jgi:hypothetical protein